MKPEAQRIAIAEACGWRECVTESLGCHGKFPKEYRGDVMNPFEGEDRAWLPDYFNDLNAMHEAEIACIYTKGKGMVYLSALAKIAEADYYMADGLRLQRWCASATAAQRAEAFLMTIGRWEDDK